MSLTVTIAGILAPTAIPIPEGGSWGLHDLGILRVHDSAGNEVAVAREVLLVLTTP